MMNEQDPFDEALDRFRAIVPPEQVRDANRKTVCRALAEPILSGGPWRSITVPLPAALATVAALLISLAGHLYRAAGRPEPSASNAIVENPHDSKPTETASVAVDLHAGYSETQRYVSGVGIIERKSIYWD